MKSKQVATLTSTAAATSAPATTVVNVQGIAEEQRTHLEQQVKELEGKVSERGKKERERSLAIKCVVPFCNSPKDDFRCSRPPACAAHHDHGDIAYGCEQEA